MDLGQDTTFCQLVALRKRYYSGKCTKEEKHSIKEMWAVFDIPADENYSLEEKRIIDQVTENARKAKAARNG